VKQLRHKRFNTNMNDKLSSGSCYWYVQAEKSIVPIENDNSYKRPWYVHT
jgi:hypothetical protein